MGYVIQKFRFLPNFYTNTLYRFSSTFRKPKYGHAGKLAMLFRIFFTTMYVGSKPHVVTGYVLSCCVFFCRRPCKFKAKRDNFYASGSQSRWLLIPIQTYPLILPIPRGPKCFFLHNNTDRFQDRNIHPIPFF